MGVLQARILEWAAMPSSRGFFPVQGLNPGLPRCGWILYHLSYQRSPRILQWVAYPFSRGSSQPGIEPRSPALWVDSLPSELPGKPKNTAVGSLSLLKRIFPTQELNQGLLHCRQILYQLSSQGCTYKTYYLIILNN